MVRKVRSEDAKAIADIYNYYILHTVVTFEESEVDAAEMESRILEITTKLPWLVYEEKGEVLGYAYATDWKSRCAYKHSAEITVYLNPSALQQGIGSQLYKELVRHLKELEMHAIIGGIALPNEGSVRLHEKFGFEKVAQFKEVGYKFNRWIDVGYWELIL